MIGLIKFLITFVFYVVSFIIAIPIAICRLSYMASSLIIDELFGDDDENIIDTTNRDE